MIDHLQTLSGITILINNVGGATPSYMKTQAWDLLDQISPKMFDEYYQLNIMPMITLCHTLLPQMFKQNQGYILNVSSLNGFSAVPQATAYCNVKAFIISYSANLKRELARRTDAIHVDCVCPGTVATDAQGRAGFPTPSMPDPFEFADQTLKYAKTPYVKIPWFRHWQDRFKYGRVGHFNL